jgi:predicted ArsR family transcriptional regulator
MVAKPSSYRTLASFSRINLLYHLQKRGTMTVNDLATVTGLHPNTAREHLARLIDENYVTCEPESRDTKGRPRMMYSAVDGCEHLDEAKRNAKVALAERRADQVRILLPIREVARTPEQRQIDVIEDHLDQSGYDWDIDLGAHHVHLHQCPFADMVRDHPEVCGVHFRILQSLLQQTGGPLEADRIHPFSGADTCTVDIAHSGSGAGDAPTSEAAIIHGVSVL